MKIVPYMRAVFAALVVAVSLAAVPADAGTIWVDWTSESSGAPGSAFGSLGGVNVTYSGELFSPTIDGTSTAWDPDTSWIGGSVTESPSVVGDDLKVTGFFYDGVSSITFSAPVVNPVFALWSLGSPFTTAALTFTQTPTFQAGGPNALPLGGGPIVVNGHEVSGMNSNGVVQFTGTFSSISWTTTPDFFFAFTVGSNGGQPPTVPEPASLMLVGVAAAGLISRRLRR